MGLLTTGEAARMLGTSRQHVVDLCDGGQLPCTRVGTHRRIDRSAVDALLVSPPRRGRLRREQLLSLWLHHAVAGRLVSDPEAVINQARRSLDRMATQHPAAQPWIDAWRRTLDRGANEVLHVLTSPDPSAVELRQNSPFAGTLTEAERQRVISSVRKYRDAVPG